MIYNNITALIICYERCRMCSYETRKITTDLLLVTEALPEDWSSFVIQHLTTIGFVYITYILYIIIIPVKVFAPTAKTLEMFCPLGDRIKKSISTRICLMKQQTSTNPTQS